MPRKLSKTLTILAAGSVVAGALSYVPVAQAFGFGDMMNPSKWMGGKNRDRYDDDYYDGPYGGGPGYGGPGYGYGGPGYGYGGPGYGGPGYGAPGYGYGAPGYGYGAPAVAPAPAAAPAAAPARSSSASEIEALKRRIDELESSQSPSTPAPASNDWPSAPAFRPMSKY